MTSVGSLVHTAVNITIEVRSAFTKMLIKQNNQKEQVKHKIIRKNRRKRKKLRKLPNRLRGEGQREKNRIPMFTKKNLQERRYLELDLREQN